MTEILKFIDKLETEKKQLHKNIQIIIDTMQIDSEEILNVSFVDENKKNIC